jgi:two-component system, NarL family, nitrate/nitrite response regulator NarL
MRGRRAVIRTFIVAEIRLYREGLAWLLDAEKDMRVVGKAAAWVDAVGPVRRAEPDVVLLDAVAEAGAAVNALRGAIPQPRVVALSIGDAEADILPWAEAGVAGFVTREDSIGRLLEVVRGVVHDELPCSPQAASTLLRRVGALASNGAPVEPHARLTSRELEIVRLIERGLSNKEIGRELCIELATVKNHVHNILEKLQVRRRTEAVARLRGGPARPVAPRAVAP